ncbi:L-aminoadipate-semialdehyde dehydrogenase-phosphopantetheinyl transferase-like [Dysidea avara]|uniref:L-aminoadipate-semialdehyde dehydrogenase-phosphopantetheinyl transferase-like n=1 Tax=Dysidea avara TaxID=196820 RepID=UPI00331ED658
MNRGLRWAFNTSIWSPTKEEWVLACSCIQAEEKERISGFVHAKDAKLSMGGRLLIRRALVQLLGLPNTAIKLTRGDRNKPELVGNDNVQFNVSHDGCYVVLAVEQNRKVGVDVMQMTRRVGASSTAEFFRQMNRQFTEREWQCILREDTEKSQLATFFRLWCLKESYIKAIGRGIGIGLQHMEFTLSPLTWNQSNTITGSTLTLDGVVVNEWTFEESYLDNEHCVCAAVCCHDNNSPNKFIEVNITDLLTSLKPLHTPNQLDYDKYFTKL